MLIRLMFCDENWNGNRCLASIGACVELCLVDDCTEC